MGRRSGRFAGDDIGRAVFHPEDERFLVERYQHTGHYELVWSAGRVQDVE